MTYGIDLSGHRALVTGAGQGVGREIATHAGRGRRRGARERPRARARRGGGRRDRDRRWRRPSRGVRRHRLRRGGRRDRRRRPGRHPGEQRRQRRTRDAPWAWRTSPPWSQTDPSDWEGFIKVNFYGVMYAVRAALPAMIDAQWGRVVTVISDTARVGETHMAAYSAAKAGAAGFCRSVAREVGRHNITVNCVALGTMNTQGIPPEEDHGVEQLLQEVRHPAPGPAPRHRRDGHASSRAPGRVDHRPDLSGQRRLLLHALTRGRGAGTIIADGNRRRRPRRSRRSRLPGRRGPRHRDLPRHAAPAPAAARGRGRRRQDRGGQGAGPLDRRRARPPAVLRGHRRRARRSTSGTTPASCCTSARSRPAAARSSRTSSTPSGSS